MSFKTVIPVSILLLIIVTEDENYKKIYRASYMLHSIIGDLARPIHEDVPESFVMTTGITNDNFRICVIDSVLLAEAMWHISPVDQFMYVNVEHRVSIEGNSITAVVENNYEPK